MIQQVNKGRDHKGFNHQRLYLKMSQCIESFEDKFQELACF